MTLLGKAGIGIEAENPAESMKRSTDSYRGLDGMPVMDIKPVLSSVPDL